MKLVFIAAFFTLLTLSVKADYVHDFIIEYLRCRNIYAATFLICGSNRGILKISTSKGINAM